MSNDPEAAKVREWRHKLQKAFLNQKATPKDEVRIYSSVVDAAPLMCDTLGHARARPALLYGRELPEDDHPVPISE